MPKTAISILGTNLDSGLSPKRWQKWRPTVAACQHEDLLLDKLELLYPDGQKALAQIIQRDIADVSPETKVRLHELTFGDPWDFEEVFAGLHDFAAGYSFRTRDTEYLFNITTGTHVQQICLFLLTESRHLPGKLLQLSPPRKRAEGTNPGRWTEIDLDLSRYNALAARFAAEQQEGQNFLKAGIETRNDAFNRMIERIERVAIASTAPLLLTGPTGAGKTKLARRIYELKRRREQINGELIEVNCATLRGDQAMSALFGHVKGAFTGAASARPGLLKAAHGGLLFLDEIGELGLDEQAMLLRAVEEQKFLPVGSDTESTSHFQLIAGTNRELRTRVRDGKFREDLLARINLWTFCLPGLTDRMEDLEPNIDFELQRLTQELGRKVSLTREAREQYLSLGSSSAGMWFGNFRDLNASMTRMATLAEGGRIDKAQVTEEWERLSRDWSHGKSSTPGTLSQFLTQQQIQELDLFDQAQLATVLDVCHRSATLAAAGRQLFAVSRTQRTSRNDSDRLRKYLARFDLTWQSIRKVTQEDVD